MNILIVGNGGREYAIALKLKSEKILPNSTLRQATAPPLNLAKI